MWLKQAIVKWSWHVNSIVAYCHSVKLCTCRSGFPIATKNGAVTRMWRSCCVKPSQKARAIAAVRCKNEGMLLQPLCWRCVECVVYHEQNMQKKQHYIYVVRTSNSRVCELYCCLLPQCETLHTCHSGFPITTTYSNYPLFSVW